MDYMTFMEIVMTIGIVPAILLAFMFFFFRREKKLEEKREERETRREEQQQEREKKRDEQVEIKDEYWKKELISNNEVFRNVIDNHLSEGVRREEMLHKAAEKREEIIRQEAEKREAMLMRTIDGFGDSMNKLSDAMVEMSKTLFQIDFRLSAIEENNKQYNKR